MPEFLTEFESPQKFIADLEQLLANPTSHLAVPAAWLIALPDRKQVKESFDKAGGDKPSYLKTMHEAASRHKDPVGYVEVLATSIWARFKFDSKRAKIRDLVTSFELRRERQVLGDRDIALLRGMASLYAANLLDGVGWQRFLTVFVWADGQCSFYLPKRFQRNEKDIPAAKTVLREMVQGHVPSYAELVRECTIMLTHYRNHPGQWGKAINEALDGGATWFKAQDAEVSKVFKSVATPHSLILGRAETGEPLYYEGEASLITIGSPGTGKTQSQVIPNLLTYPGSAFVLDVKGELWEKTAGYRQKNFGPVYRFSPTNKNFRSHCFNPFDLVSRDPNEAANQCQTLAKSLIPGSPGVNDPYWENRARDMVWAFAMLVALDTIDDARNLGELSRLLSFPTNFEGNEGRARFPGSDTEILVGRLRDAANRYRIPELRNTADSILDGVQASASRLSSVVDNAQSHLSVLSRSPMAAEALSRSDWSPLDLREKPGTTVYLSFKPGEMRAFAAIIRIIIDKHAEALTQDFERRPDQLPITFFLDEMPQLGFMESLNDLMDVGRGAGVRLWLFAQYMGQIRDNYGARADGLISSPQIRCFMQPDLEAARFIAPQLGTTRNVLTGERKNLADINELTGKKYGEKIIILPRNENPALLDPFLAYKEMPERMDVPAPDVPASRLDEDWLIS